MISIYTWTTTIICLTGNVFNVKKSVICFYIWTLGNVLWLTYDCYSGLYSRAFLDIVQTVFSVWGIIEWSKKGD